MSRGDIVCRDLVVEGVNGRGSYINRGGATIGAGGGSRTPTFLKL